MKSLKYIYIAHRYTEFVAAATFILQNYFVWSLRTETGFLYIL